jgi:tetratricopeptide (TPR) repeat protein
MRLCAFVKKNILPVYERLGDVRSKAVTMGKIADILQARGQLDEALRIYQENIPIREQLKDVRGKAVIQGKIADILQARGQLDEALRINKEVLIVFEHLVMCEKSCNQGVKSPTSYKRVDNSMRLCAFVKKKNCRSMNALAMCAQKR